MVEMFTFKTRDEWKQKRGGTIGGSECSCIVNRNPWKNNVELWLEKTGQCVPDDISKKDVVIYGSKAEKPLRDLFKLDFPEFKVEYKPNNFWTNDKYPFAHASLDGWLTEKETGKKGVLEIKTTNILRSMQREKWDEQIPDNYFCQVLWYMAVTEFDFAIVRAALKGNYGGEFRTTIRDYRIEKEQYTEDIEYLMKEAQKFAKLIEERRKPVLQIPDLPIPTII